MASVASVGAYSIGQRVSYMVFAYMTALENVFVPGVYRRMFGHEPGGGEGIGRYLTPFAYASVAIALGIALFAHEVLFVLTPPEYHAASPVIAVLSLYYAILFFGKQPQLMYAKRTMTGTVLSTVTIAITIGLNYWFIRRLGFMGAAWATLAAGVISTALFMAAGQRAYRIGWEWGKLACIYLWLVLGVGLSWAAWALPLSMPVALAAKLVMLIGYALIGVWFGILTRERVTDVIHDISARLGRPHRAATPGSPA
jgi:O-antigen/teichoic acid export membrane protein